MKKNNKYAFSLIEVMIALVVAALVITPLMRLVMRAVTVISERNSQLEHYIKLQSFLYESRLQDAISVEFSREEILTPRKTIKYTRSAVGEKSSLKVPFLTKEIVVMQEKEVSENKQDTLISFFTVLPQPKKKDEKVATKESSSAKASADEEEAENKPTQKSLTEESSKKSGNKQ
jgi:prepilin-type N-terminal cleavage/methylation domain-containing protein